MTDITSRKNCKLRKAKGQIRCWYNNNKENLKTIGIVVIILLACVTGLVWLFGDKVTQVCHEGLSLRTNGTETYNMSYYNYVSHSVESRNITVDKTEVYTNSCAYTTDSHSRYTIPESVAVVVGGVYGIGKGFVEWMLSHPVI